MKVSTWKTPEKTAGKAGRGSAGGRRRALLLAAGVGLVLGGPALLGLGGATSAGASTSTNPGGSTFRAAVGYPAGQTVTVAPGTNGAIQDAFVVRAGKAYSATESTSGSWSAWMPLLPSSTLTLTDTALTWAPGSNGSLQELFGLYTGTVWVTWQSPSGSWATWTPLGTSSRPADGFQHEPVTYAPGTGGAVQEIFAMGFTTAGGTTPTTTTGGHVYVSVEGSNGAWSAWTAIGGSHRFYYTWPDRLTYAPGSNGSTAELFAYGDCTTDECSTTAPGHQREYVTWESDGAWHTWELFGGSKELSYEGGSGVTYGPGSNGSLQEIFGITDTTFDVVVSWEAPGGTWSPWETYGATPTDEHFFFSRVTVAPGSDGSLQEIFGITYDVSHVWVDWEAPTGAWSGWESMGTTSVAFDHTTGTGNGSASSHAFVASYAPGSNGSLQELFASGGTLGYPVYVQWENPGGTWSGWKSMGTPGASGSLATASNPIKTTGTYACPPAGGTASIGTATLSRVGDTLQVTVTLTGAEPTRGYFVFLGYGATAASPCTYEQLGSLGTTADGNASGSWRITVPSSDDYFFVYVDTYATYTYSETTVLTLP